jgi:hypothetical protein
VRLWIGDNDPGLALFDAAGTPRVVVMVDNGGPHLILFDAAMAGRARLR